MATFEEMIFLFPIVSAMKKLFYSFLFFAFAVLNFSGKQIQFRNQDAKPKVAVISIYCNKEIGFVEFDGIAAMITRLADDKNFDLSPMVNDVHEKVFGAYTANLPYEFLDEDSVLNTKGYDETLLDDFLLNQSRLNYLLSPVGYVPVGTNDGKVIKKAFDVFNGIEGVMIVSVDYELVKVGVEIDGFGNAKIQATGVIRVADGDGKKLFKVVQTAKSDNEINFSFGGVFNSSEMIPLCSEAAKNLFVEMDEAILKKTEKD